MATHQGAIPAMLFQASGPSVLVVAPISSNNKILVPLTQTHLHIFKSHLSS
jgi:hypothetical protein